MIYDKDNPVVWRDLSFEQLLERLDATINYRLWLYYRGNRPGNSIKAPPLNHSTSIPGMLVDDLRQELMITVWKNIYQKKDRIPPEIIYFDYRFLMYAKTILVRSVFSLNRKHYVIDKQTQQKICRDFLNDTRMLEMKDELDEDVTRLY